MSKEVAKSVETMTRKKALEILLGEKCIYILSARSSGKEECIKAIKTIQKDLEVLEIIKVKQVDIEFIGLCADEERYNRAFVPEDDDRKLTQDEFDKVKGWLEK